MKMIVFLGETFYLSDGVYYGMEPSANFLLAALPSIDMIFVGPHVTTMNRPEKFNVQVKKEKFHGLPSYSSTKDFILKLCFDKVFFQSYSAGLFDILEEHPDASVWIRSPSMGSILFGLCAVSKNRILFNHICADFENTWRSPKYSTFEKFFGMLTSKWITKKLKEICLYGSSVNLCTGSAVEKFSKMYAPARTFQFVDIMAKQFEGQSILEKIPSAFNLLFVGRVLEDKGIFDLIYAVEKLRINYRLQIVGDGDDLERAQKLVRYLKIEDKVFFQGRVPSNHIGRYYLNSDLLVVPSNNTYEGFPRVIMEAWGYGLPIIVSNVGGIDAFVVNEVNGLVFSAGRVEEITANIERIANNHKLYSNLREGATNMKKISSSEYWFNILNDIVNRFYRIERG